jgi:hypothetical protein
VCWKLANDGGLGSSMARFESGSAGACGYHAEINVGALEHFPLTLNQEGFPRIG